MLASPSKHYAKVSSYQSKLLGFYIGRVASQLDRRQAMVLIYRAL